MLVNKERKTQNTIVNQPFITWVYILYTSVKAYTKKPDIIHIDSGVDYLFIVYGFVFREDQSYIEHSEVLMKQEPFPSIWNEP